MIYPSFDPIALSIGPVDIGWYGLMYLFGFAGGWLMGRQQCKRKHSQWTTLMVDDIVFYIALGVILGGRLGYVLFYNLDYYAQNPLAIFQIWQGGMAFHGGLVGVIVAMGLFARKYKVSIFTISDFVAPCVAPGLGFGRIGNFINSELWGKVTDSPFGMTMVDPVLGSVKRYPTQLLESLLEGLFIGVILWIVGKKPTPPMFISGLFLLLYGLFRSFVELFRLPDAHIGYLLGDWLTMGHILSFPMVAIGLIMITLSQKNKKKLAQ
jgi:phosphatidylglycerol:prolipoprotein diacylglycerol transferase